MFLCACFIWPPKIINFVINASFYQINKDISNFAKSGAIIKLISEISISLVLLCCKSFLLRHNHQQNCFIRVF